MIKNKKELYFYIMSDRIMKGLSLYRTNKDKLFSLIGFGDGVFVAANSLVNLSALNNVLLVGMLTVVRRTNIHFGMNKMEKCTEIG